MNKKVVIMGAGGRMGRTLIRCLLEKRIEGLELFGAVDLWDDEQLGMDAGQANGLPNCGVEITCNLEPIVPNADVVIDFSYHVGSAGNAERIAEWGVAWIIGTTGYTEDELSMIDEASKKIPIVRSGNMSLGINLLCMLVEEGAKALNGRNYDVEVIERHHRKKIDAPSGTAIMLGESLANGYNLDLKDAKIDGRVGQTGVRSDLEIGFHAVRGGDIIGDHCVLFAGDGEILELKHRATDRDVFAIGALQAAIWACSRNPGLYGMRDVLGI